VLLILQVSWSAAAKAAEIVALVAAAKRRCGADRALVLLPLADEDDALPSEAEVAGLLQDVARTADVYVAAAAALVEPGTGVRRTVAFLVSADRVELRVPKVTPDLVDGFSDTTSALAEAARFPVARTQFGQIALLPGEDVLMPHLVRSAALAGAELILNPMRELTDDGHEIRQIVRRARAYENTLFLAHASPATTRVGGATVALPAASALCDWTGKGVRAVGGETFLICDYDLQKLRRVRRAPGANFPAIVRTGVYAPDYRRRAEANRPQAPATRAAWIEEGKRRAAAQIRPSVHQVQTNYPIVIAQHVVHIVRNAASAEAIKMKNVEQALALIEPRVGRTGARLAIFPEFFVTGAQVPRGPDVWARVGVRFPGPETDRLAAFAAKHKIYVAGGVFEADDRWPGRFFNTAFIFDDAGNLIHRYRKIHCADLMGTLPVTTPGSVFTEYVETYGYEHLFPVADTPIGRIGTMICFDVNFPETARALVQRGAEIILHPTSEPHNAGRTAWEFGRRARAFENTAYIVSAAMGGEYLDEDDLVPNLYSRGHAKLVGFDGAVQAVADGPGRIALDGRIDLAALRRARSNARFNLALWDEPAVYADAYAAGRGMPNDLWADLATPFPYRGMQPTCDVIARYERDGIYAAPD
jgi:predicted amidohydrolase